MEKVAEKVAERHVQQKITTYTCEICHESILGYKEYRLHVLKEHDPEGYEKYLAAKNRDGEKTREMRRPSDREQYRKNPEKVREMNRRSWRQWRAISRTCANPEKKKEANRRSKQKPIFWLFLTSSQTKKKEALRKYVQNNREKVRQWKRDSYKLNIERMRQRARDAYQRNKKALQQKSRTYRAVANLISKKNPEKIRACNRLYRERKKAEKLAREAEENRAEEETEEQEEEGAEESEDESE
ncbi:hypothetical protein BGW37DRAFT_525757 [Umbelopsis sp. PMI_123]|nr:hypothetical protein BGW37DRAFT_525757 [Umbelopsis sp. PMI_123]